VHAVPFVLHSTPPPPASPELVPPELVPPELVPPELVPPELVPPELVPPELVDPAVPDEEPGPPSPASGADGMSSLSLPHPAKTSTTAAVMTSSAKAVHGSFLIESSSLDSTNRGKPRPFPR
jgi:hypothetical protein